MSKADAYSGKESLQTAFNWIHTEKAWNLVEEKQDVWATKHQLVKTGNFLRPRIMLSSPGTGRAAGIQQIFGELINAGMTVGCSDAAQNPSLLMNWTLSENKPPQV